MKKITILIPAYNEEESLPIFYNVLSEAVKKLPSQQYECDFLFIDDGSVDSTLDILRELVESDRRVHYLSFSRNFGKEAALLAGFDAFNGDALIPMDADLQHPPELILDMVKYWEDGYEDVYARRENRDNENFLRRWASTIFYRMLQYSTNLDLLPNVGDFRLLDRRCVNALRALKEHSRYTKGLFCWIGFRKKEIVYNCQNRIAGQSSWSFFSLFCLAINGFLTFTVAPLRFVTLCGLGVSLFAFVECIWVIIKTVCWGERVTGFPTIMVVMLFLGGMQLLSLGLIGEYLGRVFEESKGRPNYLVAERDGERI